MRRLQPMMRFILRYLRSLFILVGVGLCCALISGLLIGSHLVNNLNNWSSSQTDVSITPIPMADALAAITSLRMSFRAETADNTFLMTGNAIFIAPDDSSETRIPDFYLHWNLISPPDEQELLLSQGKLFSRSGIQDKWTRNTALAGEALDMIITPAITDGAGLSSVILPLLGIQLSDGMAGWTSLSQTDIDGQPMQLYQQDDMSILIWQLLMPQYRDIFHSAAAELSMGLRDHLPYRLRYTLFLGDTLNDPNEALTFTITLGGFNEPVMLVDPTQNQ